MPRRLTAGNPTFASEFAALLEGRREAEASVDEAAAAILKDVKARGDEALIDYTHRFDRVRLDPSTLKVSAGEIDDAWAATPPDMLEALILAARRIDSYHRKQFPQDLDYIDDQGVWLGARWRALASAGLYVPGGTASYPSSVLMNAIPAQVAGVKRLVMVVPAPDGTLNPLVLAAARLVGIEEIYRVGGAQAVAALAFGTATIKPVDKIVGPGNAFVASAKRQLFGTVGIDMIAGPSEILVVADRHNDPDWIAADLLSQAEHDRMAQAILITDDREFASLVAHAAMRRLASLPRVAIAAEAWERQGAIIEVEDLEEAIPLIDALAPEHLELAFSEAEDYARRIQHAGAIFLGRYTPEAIGDYVGGPNHVLPTGRSARFSSGLGTLDFMKRTSLIRLTEASLKAIGPAAVTLARAEGLEAHALSVALRL